MNRFRPETEPRKASAGLSEGIAQMRSLLSATGCKFCMNVFFNTKYRLGSNNRKVYIENISNVGTKWGISSIGRVRALQA